MEGFKKLLIENNVKFKSDDLNKDILAPVTLFPVKMSKESFQQAVELQPLFNELIYEIVEEAMILEETCEKLGKSDEFVEKLHEIYKKVTTNPKKIFFNLNRSDYMIDRVSGGVKQVEINTVSTSLSGLSQALTQTFQEAYPSKVTIPANHASKIYAKGFMKALEAYKQEFGIETEKVAILFLVKETERNYYDQWLLEREIRDLGDIEVIRKPLNYEGFSIEEENRVLRVEGKEIGIVYYRCGYEPEEYKSKEFWTNRGLLEESRAVKCPDIAAHLAGLKKIQQVITNGEILMKLVRGDREKYDRLKASFVGIYSLEDDQEGDKNAKMAMEEFHRFVVKPQREGGGNNIYGEKIRGFLEKISKRDRAGYILMELIKPEEHETIMIREGRDYPKVNGISELGIYGVYLRRGCTELVNRYAGYLVRTKPVGVDEGGVIAGCSAIDVPELQ